MKTHTCFDQNPLSSAVRRNLPTVPLCVLGSAFALSLALSPVNLVNADTFVVSNTNNSGPGSLRQAMTLANNLPGKDEINLTSISGNINTQSNLPVITQSVNIIGPGKDRVSIKHSLSIDMDARRMNTQISGLTTTGRIIIRGQVTGFPLDSIVTISDVGMKSFTDKNHQLKVTLENCTISGDNASVGIDVGYADVSVNNCVITGHAKAFSLINSTGHAAYYFGGPLQISNSVISGNQLAGNLWAGTMILTGSSVSGNNMGILAGGNLMIENSVIENNDDAAIVLSSDPYYGVLSHVRIQTSTISGNAGAGVEASPTFTSKGNNLQILDSTISGNDGAGIAFHGQTATILNSTIVNNAGGGIINSAYLSRISDAYNSSADMPVTNTVISGNAGFSSNDLAGDTPINISYSLIQDPGNTVFNDVVSGSTLVGVNPLLGPLQDNGGPTRTHALLTGSPAIDAADSTQCNPADQRSFTRPANSCDMGAYEFSAQPLGNGAMGDYVWVDSNGDGIQDANEAGLPGVTVNLFIGCDSNNSISTTTDANGAYRFQNLAPNKYQLQFIKPAGFSFSPPIAAGNFSLDSNANPVTGLDQCRPIAANQQSQALDAGLIPDDAATLAWSLNVAVNNQPAFKPGPVVTEGALITWTYTVINDGGVPLDDVVIRGRRQLPTRGDWGTLCSIGDVQPGTSASCSTTDIAIEGVYKLLIVAKSIAQDEQVEALFNVFYIGQAGQVIPLQIEATLQALANGQDATKPGPVLTVGDAVNWTYSVTNDGNVPLTDVSVRGRRQLPTQGSWENVCTIGIVQPGATKSCVAVDSVIEGTYKSLIVARGVAGNEQIEELFNAFYVGDAGQVTPPIATTLQTQINGQDTTKPGHEFTAGDLINWTYTVSNDGNVPINNVSIIGRRKLPTQGDWATLCNIGLIQPGTAGSCITTDTAIEGAYKKLIVAKGDVGNEQIEELHNAFYTGRP